VTLTKVLPDYTGVKTKKAKKAGEKIPTYLSKLVSFLSVRGAADKGMNSSLLSQRDSNKFHVIAWDHALHGGLGLPLSQFVARSPLKPLEPGEKRYLVDVATLPDKLKAAAKGRKFRSCILSRGGGRRFEVNWSDKRRCVLSSAVDMGPIGWPNKVFLYTKAALRGYPWPDPAHRRTDNVGLSVSEANLSSARGERVIVNNVMNGPYDGSANFHLVLAAAKEYFANANAQDELYRTFYSRICEDLFGECGPDFGTEAHYEEVWERLQALPIWRSRGRMLKLGRWFQFEEKTLLALPYDSVFALVLAYLGLVKGWHKSFFETKAGGGGVKIEEAPTLAAHVPSDARHKVKMAKSNIVGSNLGKKVFQNTLHLSSHIFADRFSRAASIGMCALVEPLRLEHGITQKMLQTVRGHREWYQTMALGTRGATVSGIVAQMGSPELNEALRMDHLYQLDAAEADKLTAMLFTFGMSTLLEEAIYLLSYHLGIPGRFLALCSRDADGELLAACYIRDVWAVLGKAETLATTNDGRLVRAWLKDLVWAHSTWCREIAVAIDEANGDGPPEDIREELFWVSTGPLYTTPVEQAFNLVRRSTDKSANRDIGKASVWSRCVNSELIVDSGHKEVVVTSADEVQKPGDIKEMLFKAKAHENDFSLGPACLDAWVSGSGWPSPSAQNFFKQFMMNGCLLDCEHNLKELGNVWLSLLAAGQCALTSSSKVTSGDEVYVVLGACELGVLTWRSTIHFSELSEFTHIVLDQGQGLSNAIHICIKDVTTFKAIPYEPKSLTNVLAEGIPSDVDSDLLGTFVLRVFEDEPVPLLSYAGMQSFKGLTVHYLSKLVTQLEIKYKPPKPTVLYELLKLTIQHVFPCMPAAAVEELIKHRTKTDTLKTVIDGPVADLVGDVLDDDENSLVRKIANKERTQPADFRLSSKDPVTIDPGEPPTNDDGRPSAKRRRPRAPPPEPPLQPAPSTLSGAPSAATPRAPPPEPPPQPAPSPPSAVASTPSAAPPRAPPPEPLPQPATSIPSAAPEPPAEPPAPGGPRVRHPQAPRLEDFMFTVHEARQWAPKWPGCVLCVQENCRWEIKYKGKPIPPYSRTMTWGRGVSHVNALTAVLEWAWGQHSLLGRGECPYDFGSWSRDGPAFREA